MSGDDDIACDLRALSKKKNSSYSDRLSTFHHFPIQINPKNGIQPTVYIYSLEYSNT